MATTRRDIDPERRKQLASSLRKNELLPELLAERREEIRDEWEATEPDDVTRREALHVELRAVLNLRDYIDGQLSAAELGDG